MFPFMLTDQLTYVPLTSAQVNAKVIAMFKSGQIDATMAMELLAGKPTSSNVTGKVANDDSNPKKRPCPEPETSTDSKEHGDDDADVDQAVDEAVGGTILDS